MKILLIFLFLLSIGIDSNAQNGYTVTGTVRSGTLPVESAKVVAVSESDPSKRFAFETDASGVFRFALPSGRYNISASKGSGRYSVSSETSAIEIHADTVTTVDITLAFAGSINESVTISADITQPIDEVSKTVNVITGQEMRERADLTLAESLRSIPGFRVQQLGGFGRTASIKTRGLRNQDTAILIDGVRLRDASAITGDASPFLSDITLTSVSRVEVLRGSGSSVYGTNAIGGVVDLQTPSPRSGWHGQVSGAFGGLGLGRFRGNISNRFFGEKLGFNAALSRTAYTKGIDGNDNSNNTNFQSRIDFSPTSKTNISGRIFYSNAFVRLNSSPDTLRSLPPTNATVIEAIQGANFSFDLDDPDATQRSRFLNGQIVFHQVFNNELSLKGHYSGLSTRRRNDNGILGVGFQSPSTSFFDGLIQTGNATLNWSPNSNHDIRVGYEFEHEKFGNDGFTPSGTADFFTDASQSSKTLFAQDLISIYGGRLQFAGGFRVQLFDLKDPKFSLANAPYADVSTNSPPAAITFDGAASYYFRRSGTKIRAHVGNGYRVPSLYERFGTFFSTFPSNSFVALGDPNLRPEKTIAFDAGVDQYVANEKIKLTAVYFYTKLIDTVGYGNVVPDIGSTTRPFGGYENQKGGIARGGEFSGTFKPTSSTDIFASFTFTKSLQREPQVSGTGVLDTFGIPQNQFTLVATQRFRRFWVNVDLLLSSSYLAPIFSNSTFNTYVYRLDGNRRADLTAGYTFKLNKEKFDLRLFSTIENLFDNEYFENGFRTAGINGRIGVSFGF